MGLFPPEDLQHSPQSRLVLVEGINGSGKSTYVREFVDTNSQCIPIRTYRGRSFHPVDLSRIARFTPEEYSSFCALCSREIAIPTVDMQQRIDSQCRYHDGYHWVSYTKIAELANSQHLLSLAHSHEIYDGFVDVADYMGCHLPLWQAFPGRVAIGVDRTVHLFEGVTLQYPIMNLLGFYDLGSDEIFQYINNLLMAIKPLSPCLVYLDVIDVRAAIRRAAAERPKWIDQYSRWLSHTLFARNTGASGESGVIKFCKRRKEVERYVLERVPIPVRIVQRHDITK